MSYFGNNNSGNNPLAFPSYNQSSLQSRNIAALNNITGSVSQIQHQFHRQHIAPHLQQGQPQTQGPNAPSVANGAGASRGNTVNTGGQPPNRPPLESQQSQGSGGSQKDKNSTDNIDDKLLKRERKNRPGQKFGAKKKSWVWTWFVQDSSDPNVAVCDYCGKIITRMPSDKGSPKKLSEHLKTHKLSKDSINTTRPIPIDGNGITYTSGGLQMAYSGTFPSPSGGNAVVSQNNEMLVEQQQQQQQQEEEQQQQQQHQQQQHMIQHPMSTQSHAQPAPQHNHEQDDISPELKTKNKYRRTNGMQSLPNDRMQIHPQLSHPNATSQNNTVQYGRRFISPNFDNTPYSAGKFHRHLLKFLTDNKLAFRLLKSHSFQQLIYDLRPDSITDLLELTGLYSSFVEVSRVANDADNQEAHESSMAEASVVNTLAQELIKK